MGTFLGIYVLYSAWQWTGEGGRLPYKTDKVLVGIFHELSVEASRLIPFRSHILGLH